MDAAALVREARHKAGLSQRRLSIRTGIPQPAIARIEAGRVSPRSDTLGKLLTGCGMSVSLLARPGYGVDRTAIRELLTMTPDERVRLLAASARNLNAFYSEARRAQ